MAYIDQDECRGCGDCRGACFCGALSFKAGEPSIDQDQCSECNVCISICPVEAIKPGKPPEEAQ